MHQRVGGVFKRDSFPGEDGACPQEGRVDQFAHGLVDGGGRLFAEAWIKNAFDTRYVPLAFPYLGFAPSGFIGENGRPRTFGISGGVTF